MLHTNILLNRKKEYGYKFSIFVVVFFLASVSFPSLRFLSQYNFLLLPFIGYVINRKRIYVPKQVSIILLFLTLFSGLHVVIGHLTLIGGISFVLSMAVALYGSVMIGKSLISIFVSIMKFFAITSLFIWVLVVIMPEFHSLLSGIGSHLPQMMSKEWLAKTSNEGVSLYIYYLPVNTETAYTSFIRNNGPFYEPGLFASYLNIALVFNLCLNRRLFEKNNILLILAILSTFSSGGYISLMLIVFFSIFMQKTRIYKIITIISVIIFLQPFIELNFIKDKITDDYNNAHNSSSSRFGAVLYHWEKVQLSPIIGYAGGTTPDTNLDRIMGTVDNLLSPNGLSYVFVFWGIPLALFFYYHTYNGFRKLSGVKNRGILLSLYLVILSTAFSQTITTGLFILTLAALSFTLKDDYCENCDN